MFYNVELQKRCPSGKPKYFLNGKLMNDRDENGENLDSYDFSLANEYDRVKAMLKTSVWRIEYGNGGYIAFNWKKDDKEDLIISEKLVDYGVSELKVEDCKDTANEVDIIWKNKDEAPIFRIRVDHDSDKCVMIPVRPKEVGQYVFAG